MHNRDWIRPPAVAGTFYPDDPQALKAQLESFCVPIPAVRDVPAIFAPHAGYRYSGRFAGEIYRRIRVPDTVIVLCPNHTGRGRKVSLWGTGAWVTPLGEVPVATELAAQIAEALGEDSSDRDAHLFEHAIEVQLPFLQWRNPSVEIVPLVLGPLTPERCLAVGDALSSVIQRRAEAPLLVSSTDMSHYIPVASAAKLDKLALDQVVKMNAAGLYRTVSENDISMCGMIPTTAVTHAASRLGCRRGEVLTYGHSGEVTGDNSSVVAYASGWFLSL